MTSSSLRLSVSDNGVGMDESLDIDNTDSLGLRLVRTLTKQLGGRLSTNADEGTTFIVEFNNAMRKEHGENHVVRKSPCC